MWENHAHKSSHTASLTVKTFALSAIIAYLGLGLSAFVYVPFGEGLMQQVQLWLFTEMKSDRWQWGKQLLARKSWKMSAIIGNAASATVAGAMGAMSSTTSEKPVVGSSSIWDMDVERARQKLDPKRLKDQMFAYAVTNQVVDTFMEVGMPFVMRAFNNFWKNGGKVKKITGSGSSGAPKTGLGPTASPSGGSVISASGSTGGSISGSPSVRKRVVFEDEQERGGMEEREFLDKVRAEAALPEYDLFGDYSEMVTQFGYIAVWSAIWPLTPGWYL